jgi:tetratricopeptide (TPR) repeat protein
MLVTGRLVLFNILLFLLCLFPYYLTAQVYPDAEVDSLLRTGIEHIVNHRYEEAESTFVVLDNKYPGLPLGKIYLAAVRIAYVYDFETPFDDQFIEDNLQRAQSLSERLLEHNKSDKWNVYFYGLARGYSAYYEAVKGNWLSALSKGLSAVSAFEECLELDPDFHEAWIAIGTYEYWKSRKTEFLSWLPFVNDNRSIGIERLRHAIDSSVYNTHIAIHSLIWIYIDQKNYSSASELSKTAVEKFPGSRVFKWGLARAYEEVDTKKSIDIYFKILNSYLQTGIRTRVNEITLKHIIAQQYMKLGEKQKAIKLCTEILDLNDLTKFEKEKLDDRLKRVRTLHRELSSE